MVGKVKRQEIGYLGHTASSSVCNSHAGSKQTLESQFSSLRVKAREARSSDMDDWNTFDGETGKSARGKMAPSLHGDCTCLHFSVL